MLIVQGGGYHGISHMYVLYVNQINPLYYLLFLYHPTHLLVNNFQCIFYTLFVHRCNVS
jgi:hypothetical protein